MFEKLLRLIGLGGGRGKPDRMAEMRRLVELQWQSMTPEERTRAERIARMMQNSLPPAYPPEYLRPMTEEELARYNDLCREMGGATIFGTHVSHTTLPSTKSDGPLDWLYPGWSRR